MRGLSLSYRSIAQKPARFGMAFGAGLARLAVGFHLEIERCAPRYARIAQSRSYDPSPLTRTAPNACGSCLFSVFGDAAARPAQSFADHGAAVGFRFSQAVFLGIVLASAYQQRAVKSCVNHFLQSPLFPSQPLQAVWTTMQNARSQAALLARSLQTPRAAMPRLALLQGLLPARCATTQACVTKVTTKILALSARLRAFMAHENQGFRAGPLGSLFSCA
jgi:hypothetical protein